MAKPPFLSGPEPEPLKFEDTYHLEAWAVRVQAGEVPPREVGEQVRGLVAQLRATLSPASAPRPATSPDGAALWSVDEAAAWLGEPRRSRIYDAIYAKRIPDDCVVRVGRKVKIHAARFVAWVEAGGTPLPPTRTA